MLTQIYASLRVVLMKKLQRAVGYSCTLDAWTSPFYTDAMMCLTSNCRYFCHYYCYFSVHFIDSSWMLQNMVLCLAPANESHTGDFISAILKRMLTSWNKNTESMNTIVTDGAKNMVAVG